ncbi:acyl-CoA dehydrogenase C-terminal domain-containing protein [Microbulbifer salipaludis]|uniref:Acyl-CoA dehydrogenase C-terminal domain-containing protein n=1 Tax=Microbulbifer salipaludis TaxID=187980 RepID=A0ABS3E3H8_9GAMM|nr:acyl-CoA dehydrogenase C-terminal domain-containing protein [Microbulbifer salipaludis]MBN8429812.1 acyl-CoA dehydrogenase C-terminal domain-containing protein [Microbulbifer salipaludis]
MPEYKAPLRDMQFVLQEVFDCEAHYRKLGFEDVDTDTMNAIYEEAAKFVEDVVAPLNRIGDEQGCQWNDGEVTTPDGFKEAYEQYMEAGWPTLAQSEAFGGQGLPHSLQQPISEMISAANHSWSMYPGLSHGAMATLEAHGTDAQKARFLPALVEGRWTGTMCLTEPHCGTDLGLLRTRAEANDDGSYRLNGSKIFISAGDHDLAENIVHIVLARIPGSPAGTKGISLFIVPKVNVSEKGELEERNGVHCASIEHKMGIKGSATCVLNFDDARGYLIGEVNRGLNCMFTFMNSARLGVALEGVAASEAAFQGSLAYARERLQMRALSGTKNPDGAADPIIVHPDVRRMLLTQKAFAEGGRAMSADLSLLIDITHKSTDADERARAEAKLALLTPIAKAFLTETGMESTSHGVQVYGGHGFISEWGMEQLMRDTKISCLYEGTTGIQALDLLGRKVLGSQGELLKGFMLEMGSFLGDCSTDEQLAAHAAVIGQYLEELQSLTATIGKRAMSNPEEIGAASVDYLMFAGYVVLAYYWLRMMATAQQKLAEGSGDANFYTAKLQTGAFYFDRVLPRAKSHSACIQNGGESMMAMAAEHFAF